MENKKKVSVLFFAKARELIGENSSFCLLTSVTTPERLLKDIVANFSKLVIIQQSLILALNDEYIPRNSDELIHLKAGDTVSVIPPLSGG